MPLTRRSFLKGVGGTGVTLSSGDWLLSRIQTYAKDRLGFTDVRGPGLESFSRSVCRDCPNHCSLSMRKVDQLPVGLRGTRWHPASRGALCVSGQSQMQALFDPDRLEMPILRSDAGTAGTIGEWSEAVGLLGENLRKLVKSGHGDRLAVIDGRTPSLGTRICEAWVQSIPGAHYIPLRVDGALDQVAAEFFGGGDEGRLRLDLARTGTLLLVGNELLEMDGSPVSQARAHGERRASALYGSAPTLFLGPRQGATAAKSDYWISCGPGQERDVLLGLAEALSQQHPQRTALMAQYAKSVPEARNLVSFTSRNSLENLARRLQLNFEDLQRTVRALQQFAPGVVLPGPGVLRRDHGASTARAAFALNLWTGGFREEGGLSWADDPLAEVAAKLGLPARKARKPEYLADILGPLFQIKRSSVDVLICIEANLVQELPGQDQIARALSHVPFVASFSSHDDETSQLSHVTLPTLLDLESWDLPAAAWGLPEAAIQVQQPAIVPVVDARSVEDVLLELAASGAAGPGFSAPAKSIEETVKRAIGSIVKEGKGELVEATRRRPLAKANPSSAEGALLTGEAVWVAHARLRAPAMDGHEKLTPPPPLQDLAPEQLWLVPFDSPAIQTGRILNRPMMMEIAGMPHGVLWDSWVEVHPEDAKKRGISAGDRLKIRGPRAEVQAFAVLTRSVRTGVVAAPVGFGHSALGSVATGVGSNPLQLPHAAFDVQTGVGAWGPIPVFLERV